MLASSCSVAGDGIFSTRENGDIVLRDLRTNTSRVLVERKNVKDEHGSPLYWSSWKLSADMKYVLVKTDDRKVRIMAPLLEG